jgi:hypothetical protein
MEAPLVPLEAPLVPLEEPLEDHPHVIASARPCAAIVLDPLEAPLVPFASARQCATIVNSKNKVLQQIVLDAGVAMEPLWQLESRHALMVSGLAKMVSTAAGDHALVAVLADGQQSLRLSQGMTRKKHLVMTRSPRDCRVKVSPCP